VAGYSKKEKDAQFKLVWVNAKGAETEVEQSPKIILGTTRIENGMTFGAVRALGRKIDCEKPTIRAKNLTENTFTN
jgi:hypothetical protein